MIDGRPDFVAIVNYVHTIDGLHASTAKELQRLEGVGTVKQETGVVRENKRLFRGPPQRKLAYGQLRRFELQQAKVGEKMLQNQLSAGEVPKMLAPKRITHGFVEDLKVSHVSWGSALTFSEMSPYPGHPSDPGLFGPKKSRYGHLRVEAGTVVGFFEFYVCRKILAISLVPSPVGAKTQSRPLVCTYL